MDEAVAKTRAKVAAAYAVACVVASDTSPAAANGQPRRWQETAWAYEYLAGAGDDEESWAQHLAPADFWARPAAFLDHGPDGCEAAVAEAVAAKPPKPVGSVKTVLDRVHWLPSGVLGLLAASAADIAAACLAESLPNDCMLVSCDTPWKADASTATAVVGLGMKPDKRGRDALEVVMPKVIPRLAALLRSSSCRVVVACPDGVTAAPAVALAILTAATTAEGEVTKPLIAQRLAQIVAAQPAAHPPRPLLKAVNEYFMPDPRTLPASKRPKTA